jgi:di/tricarboxylate transporter
MSTEDRRMDQSPFTSSDSSAAWGVLGSIALAAVVLLLPTPQGLTPEGQRLGALFAGILVLWATEALPIAVTALLPLMTAVMLLIAPLVGLI